MDPRYGHAGAAERAPQRRFAAVPIVRAVAAAMALVAIAATSPVRADLLARADQDAYRAAFAAARANDWPTVHEAAGRGHDALLDKTLHWLELSRSATAEFADIVDFLEHN